MIWNLFTLALIIVAHTAADDKQASKNPGYDVTPLSKRQYPAKMLSVFKDGALISDNPYCREAASALCKKVASDNLLLLSCMQNQAEVRI